MVNLPTDFLRSFVAIVKTGSILRASEVRCLTPSALSLQIKRLEESLQAPLFHRGGRQFTPTRAGEELLFYAQEILKLNDGAVLALSGDRFVGPVRVGLVQDFADTFLSGVLGTFARSNPGARLDIRVAGSAELVDLFESDRLDVVACLAEENSVEAVGSAPILWFGNSALMREPTLPLALMEKPCVFRETVVRSLEAAKTPYRVALETSSLSAVRAAVGASIAVTCRTAGFSDCVIAESATAHMPAMPRVAQALLLHVSAHPIISRLADLLRASMLDLND